MRSEPIQSTDIAPRLLDLRSAAQYVGLSVWTLRELVLAGQVPAVRPPAPLGRGTLRRVLLDIRDLDACIAAWKDGDASAARSERPQKRKADSSLAR